jgi:ABC-type amino acid transport system permease subunit
VINARDQNPIALYAMLAAMFFVICYCLSHAIRRLERHSLRRTALLAG